MQMLSTDCQTGPDTINQDQTGLPDRTKGPYIPGDILMLEALPKPPLTAKEVARLKQEDAALSDCA